MNKTKVFIEVDEDAVDELDEFIKYCYNINIRWKTGTWGEDENDMEIPLGLMDYAKPIAKAFGLYPFNQPKVSMSMENL